MHDMSSDHGAEARLARLESELFQVMQRQEDLRLLSVQQSWRIRRTRLSLVDLRRSVYGIAVLCGFASLGAVLVLVWLAP